MANEIEQYYDEEAEAEWRRLERNRMEYAVTLRALAEHLPPAPARVLDVGSGPGRYAIVLAQQGYALTLVDLSRRSLGLAEHNARMVGVTFDACVHGNALDLRALPDAAFDAVLMMGPLYHLLTVEERGRAIGEARRVLKPGGRLFAAFIGRYAALRDMAKHDARWVVDRRQTADTVLRTGVLRVAPGSAGFTTSYMAHPSEIAPLMEAGGFAMLDLLSCEGVTGLIDESINGLTGEAWQEWVDINYRLSRDPSIHGAALHLLYVGET